MVYRKRRVRKRFRKTKRYGRRRQKRMRKVTTMSMRMPTGVPDRVKLKLSYNTFVSLAGTTGVPFQQIYQSSLFDPDLTGGGNQPLGYDQWCNFYQRYRVYGVAIKIQGSNTGSAAPLTLMVYPSMTGAAPPTISAGLSQPYVKIAATGQSTGNAKVQLSHFMSTGKIWGYPNIDQEDDFTAAYNANPAQLWFWVIYGYSGTGATPTFQGYVKLTFYCEMYERTTLDIS